MSIRLRYLTTWLKQVHTLRFDLAANANTWASGPQVPLGAGAPVARADVAWQDAESLAVVLALRADNGEVSLVTVQGDPTTGTPSVQALSGFSMGDKQRLQAVCFRPLTRGGTFAVVMADGADTEYLQVASYTNVDPSTNATVDVFPAGCVHVPTPAAAEWRGGYAGDGSAMMVAVQGDGGWSVSVLHPHTMAVEHSIEVGGQVAALAASPNATLLAVAQQGTTVDVYR